MTVAEQQTMSNLERARAAKRERIALLGLKSDPKLTAGRVADLIQECPPALERVEIIELLGRVQGFGSQSLRAKRGAATRGERLLSREGITVNRRLGELSERQRLSIAARLRAV